MGITITRDEADRPTDPLRVPERAGFVRRWVRTRGYNQEGHMSRMQEAGYVPVERTEKTESAGSDARMQTTKGTPLDTTIKRGDLMLMECPVERFAERRKAQREFTEERTKGVMTRFKDEVRRQSKREPLKE